MDPQLIKAIEEKMPSPEDYKIQLSSPYGRFGKPMELQLSDGRASILGIEFSPVDLEIASAATPLRKTIFIIEDIATGEVHVSENSRRSFGIKLIQAGNLGTLFKERFGKDFKGKVRVWWGHESATIEKYNIETYLLPRMVDKKRAGDRATVLRRAYDSMDIEMRQRWRERYPYAVEAVLTGHEDYNLRRS
jgi:hypothetical protein